MRRVEPRSGSIDYAALTLTAEEGFLLSRVEGVTDTRELVALTGLAPDQVDRIVDRLHELGVVSARHDATPRRESFLPPVRDSAPPVPPPVPVRESVAPLLREFVEWGQTPEGEVAEGELAPEGEVAEGELAPESTQDDLLADTNPPEPDSPEQELAEADYRKVYAAVFAGMPADERAARAATASGATLMALCLDPDPKVIYAVVHNALSGLDHFRFIALWHRTPQGLEHIPRESARDRQVERRLLRNPQLSEQMLGRILGPKRLLEVYKAAIDREVPERTRQKTRGVLMQRWTTAQPEERVELLLTTEARCLILLVGGTIDARSVQILCGRSSFTTMFVTSVVRFSAAPPALLAHFAKQPLVRRNPALRKLLLAHKNLPGDAKRALQGL
ncbi:MAG TPA: hypothetical protein PLR99_23935 [Polyangiaceae bacterium]|nr:hypothetical protein [Polyangiaceae bacterium]